MIYLVLILFVLSTSLVSARVDTITFNVTVHCSRHDRYYVLITPGEHDKLSRNDVGRRHDFSCSNEWCNGILTYHDNDDGFLDEEYELFLRLEHDCTEDRSVSEAEFPKCGYYTAPVGQDTLLHEEILLDIL